MEVKKKFWKVRIELDDDGKISREKNILSIVRSAGVSPAIFCAVKKLKLPALPASGQASRRRYKISVTAAH
jgi:hypothetical protein